MGTIDQQTVSYQILGVHPSADIEITLHNDTQYPTPAIPEEQDYFDFVLLRIVTPLIFGIITLLGLLGNLLVVHVIRARRKMRTVTNLLLLNLAVADLSFIVICPPFTAYQMATLSWPFTGLLGDIICKLMHYLLNVTVYVTIYTLVLISVIRYLTIVHNSSTVAFRTKRNTVIMIVLIWCIILGVNIPIPLSYGVQDFPEGTMCDNFALEIGQKLYATFFAFAYILPLSVIAVFSLCIFRHIKLHSPVSLKKNKKSNQKKKQATRLIILVIVIFAIFWLPVHIHLLVAYYSTIPDTKLYKCISVLWYCLAYCNSCVNPFIYNYTSKDFRDSFRDTVLCVKRTPDWDREGSAVTKIANGHNSPRTQKTLVVEVNGNNNQEAINSGSNEEAVPEEV